MSRRLLFFTLLAAVASAAFFLAGYKFGDRRKLTADLATAVDPRSNVSSTPTLVDVLQELQDRQQLLAQQVGDLRSRLEIMDLKTVFTGVMQRGDSGDNVSRLQELLWKIPEAYPPEVNTSGTVTGYYGYLTEIAVTRFQEQAGLKQTGIVDKETRKKLYESAANVIADENASTGFAPINLSAVADLQNLAYSQGQASQAGLTDLQGQISQLASDVSSTQASTADLQNQISQINLEISGIQANAAVAPNASLPPPPPPPGPASTPAPASSSPLLAISGVKAINITRTSSTITWTTNSPSTSEVDYSLNSSMPANQTLTTNSAVVTTNHSVVLLSLNSNTKYYYRVVSKDGTGAIASSTNLSFVTLR